MEEERCSQVLQILFHGLALLIQELHHGRLSRARLPCNPEKAMMATDIVKALPLLVFRTIQEPLTRFGVGTPDSIPARIDVGKPQRLHDYFAMGIIDWSSMNF